jgi:hypothetical protein
MTLEMTLSVHDLEDLRLSEVPAKLERGKVGQLAVMDWLGIDSDPRLVEIKHHNGGRMPGHMPRRTPPEAVELFRLAHGLSAKPRPKFAAAAVNRPATRKSKVSKKV